MIRLVRRLAGSWRCPPRAREVEPALAAAVFQSVYTSREQRLRRFGAGTSLVVKHALRGMLFSWPLYLLLVAGLLTPWPDSAWMLAIALPGLAISLYILARGAREDYCRGVYGRLLRGSLFSQGRSKG